MNRRVARRRAAVVLALFGAAAGSVAARAGGAGSLDDSFSHNGKLAIAIGSSSVAQSVAIQSNGKIVVAGYSYGPDSPVVFAVARFDRDGSLDRSFSNNGKVRTLIGRSSVAYAVAIQDDGKIVAAGYASNRRGDVFALARYHRDGSLDHSFSLDGTRKVSFGGSFPTAIAQGIVIQPDGKIVVAGGSDGGDGFDFALARLRADGGLDPSFGAGGKVTTSLGPLDDLASWLAIQPGGEIVVAGYSRRPATIVMALARYDTHGTLDASFDADGTQTVSVRFSSSGSSVAIQDDGRIVVAGSSRAASRSTTSFALARFRVDGSLDETFSTNGKRTIAVGASSGAEAVAIQRDGRIVAAGSAEIASEIDFALVRFRSDGSADTSFSGDGSTTASIGPDDYGYSLAVQPDTRIVMAGDAASHVGVARFLPTAGS